MAEYIERDKLLDKALTIYRYDNESGLLMTHKVVLSSDVVMAPPADVAPVRHGNWSLLCDVHRDSVTGEVDEHYYLECSECKRKVFDISQDAVITGRWADVIKDYPYCHCGANMTNGIEKPYDRAGDDAESADIDDTEWKKRMMQKFVGRR